MSRYTHSNLWRLESSCQRWIVRLHSAAAVPAWRALISPGALLCRLKASWTIITISSHGRRGIRSGLFTEATWALLGWQNNFKVQERVLLAVPVNCSCPCPCTSTEGICRSEAWGLWKSSWRAGLCFDFILQDLEVFSLIHKIQHCHIYLWAKNSLESLQPATCQCTFLGLTFADFACAAVRVKLTLRR